ncbi:hypothetical protein Pmani_037131 [Petrolisthes manimaculis]|uniref:PH domain-containing protein n=1 Tax=Petrolisthes manimaculis TaxID=1843537 RepID=A0AAE1NI97_9EUCA|nr:hypothetical protein Pmani_037131 [Petrolisthes manimaculis]
MVGGGGGVRGVRGGRCSPIRLTLQEQHRQSLLWSTTTTTTTTTPITTPNNNLPAVVIHPQWEITGVRNWLTSQLHIQSVGSICEWWLVDWEDGSSLDSSSSNSNGPLGPTKEGSLMYKAMGILSQWKPAYFILKGGVLYQFNDKQERLPCMILQSQHCIGCVRIKHTHRPHTFQLYRRHHTPLLLAASDENEASLWLQALLTTINIGMCGVSERNQVTSLEHLTSISLYTECPTTCILEFECSEAGEISGDWALYFRTSKQLQQFISLLSKTWKNLSQMEFPLQQVNNEEIKQFLYEGSQISHNQWSLLHI